MFVPHSNVVVNNVLMRYNASMMSGAFAWLNQFWSVRRALLRKVATAQELSLIHVEIIEYLGICNRYSNTMLAVTEYLGQTKGSVSQSLAWLEKRALVLRTPDKHDKRIVRLALSPKGQEVFKEIHHFMPASDIASPQAEKEFRRLLELWRAETGFVGFGVCHSCRYNQKTGSGKFHCGLTHEPLREKEVMQICREHKAASVGQSEIHA